MADLTLAICMYNAERYIEETLISVLGQTFRDFHLLIVDDCSTDGSVKIAEGFLNKFGREYELVSFEENRGIAYARNFALEYAETSYILFVDADDILEPNLVEREYTTITSDKDLMGVSCWSEFMNVNGQKIHGGTYLGAQTKEEFIDKASRAKLIFLPIHTMFDRELAIKSGGFAVKGFPSGKPRYQDFCEELDLWTRMSDNYNQGKAFVTLPEVLYHYRKSDGLSSNHFNMIIKMRYTKCNLRRRRSQQEEYSFEDFLNSLSSQELKEYKKEAQAADALRKGVFYLKEKNIIKSVKYVCLSLWYRPSYFWDKLRYNLKIKK